MRSNTRQGQRSTSPARTRWRVAAAVVAAALALPGAAGTAAADTSTAPSRVVTAPSVRVAGLIAQMTLDEKLSFVSPAVDPRALGSAGYLPGVPRLGIPELRLTDGPAGVRLNRPATALPAPVALASAFDTKLARQYGRTMAREGRALGQDVLLSPMANIIRVPQGGRNYETFSEDPFLTARTVAAQVRGIAEEGMIPTVKHFALNNQETDRDLVDVRVDDQTLHEVELPGFRAAVDAGAGAVMCSYNKVDGAHACGNSSLVNGVLKTELGFRGWVMSDWGATHAASDLEAGLDQEMRWVGQQRAFFTSELRSALVAGTTPVSALDDAVGRILSQMERFALLDGAAAIRPMLDLAGGAQVAQDVAEKGAVLLKNAHGALPLTGREQSIGLIGPTARTPKVGGGGSANVTPVSAASPVDTITSRASAGTSVTWAAGVPTTGGAIDADRLSPAPPFDAAGTVRVAPGTSVSFAGTLTVPADGDYAFVVDAPRSYGTLSVDGSAVATGILSASTGTVRLTAGVHQLSFFGFAAAGVPDTISLSWITPDAAASARAEAVALAKRVSTPIVFAFDQGTATADRTALTLPAEQDRLISEVAAANPRTIVVLNTGSSVTMPWIGAVDAVLDMYYPGQNGAEATARLLYGDVNPSGKLTQTFPLREDRTPIAGDPRSFPGVDHVQTYTEGIDVGYKWYDRNGVRPLFAFGHGLSYTTFDYRGLALQLKGETVSVSFTLKNTGTRAGEEVAQVYVGPSEQISAPQSVRRLVGYEKVRLQPGETRRVQISVDVDDLASWDTASQSWVVGAGRREVSVGTSSAELQLRSVLKLTSGR